MGTYGEQCSSRGFEVQEGQRKKPSSKNAEPSEEPAGLDSTGQGKNDDEVILEPNYEGMNLVLERRF